MNPAALISIATETKWTVIGGAMKGTVKHMNEAVFTIGRSPDNPFVITGDPKCSRKHANVQWTERGCEIAGQNAENPVYLNGKEIEHAVLEDNDIVMLGETEIRFNLTTGTNHITVVGSSPPATRKARGQKSKPKTSPVRLLVYFLIGIVVLFLFTGNPKKKINELTLRTEQQIQADIEAANKLQEAAQNLPVKRLDDTVISRQAQENYVRGFRDYRKGQFERSLDSFQACLALDPGHVLCNRYLRLAQRRFSEIVQFDIVLGRKYRDQNQYKACRSAFRNVMVMVKDANSAPYKEAKANYDACNAMVEGRY